MTITIIVWSVIVALVGYWVGTRVSGSTRKPVPVPPPVLNPHHEIVETIRALAVSDPLLWTLSEKSFSEREYGPLGGEQYSICRPEWACPRGGISVINPDSNVGYSANGYHLWIEKDGVCLTNMSDKIAREIRDIFFVWVRTNTDQRVAVSRFDELDEETKQRTIKAVLDRGAL